MRKIRPMKIAIAGYGIEGEANYRYWDTPENELTIADERTTLRDIPNGAKTILGDGSFSKLDSFDLIIRSPSISPKKLPYGDKVWSATNEFFAKCPAKIIGVTGTKGKGTTSSLIASIFEASGKTVHLVGNIGKPALDVLDSVKSNDVVVYELSSFQLWDLKISPQIAVILGIEPDHLDIHTDMDDYVAAKQNIALHQTKYDCLIYDGHNKISMQIAKNAANTVDYIVPPKDYTKFVVEDGYFRYKDRKLAPLSSLRIPGKHNIENTKAALLAVMAMDKKISSDHITDGISKFTGLPHRLKFVREVKGVKYYDDSIATTPGSAIAAILAFAEPKVLILGGSDKGADYEEIIEKCQLTNTKVIAIGATGEKIFELCQAYGVVCSKVVGDMKEIVARADEAAHTGDIVILSPASASFDMFDNYADRGDQFVSAIWDIVE